MPEEPRAQIIKPDPDPTIRTWESLDREVRHLRELFATQLEQRDVRIDAIEKASEVFQEGLTRVPTEVDKRVAQLKELHDAKFNAIEDKFNVRDVTAKQASEATALALQAAFQAQKEATT